MIRANEYEVGSMKMPIYDASSMTAGQMLIWGVDATSTSTSVLIDSADTAANAFAVLMETPTTTVTNINTPLVYQAKVQLIQPVHVWKIYYDMSTSTDLDVVSSTSTIVTVSAADDNLDGSWIYINSGTGAGQLRYIKAADTTTFTVSSAFATTPDSTSDYVLIRNIGFPTAGIGLNSTFDKIVPIADETSSGNTCVLKNFIEGPFGTLELDPTLNPILTTGAGLNSRGCRFFSLVIFVDTIISATGV